MRKTPTPEQRHTAGSALIDIAFLPNETDQQAYERIRLALCSAIDKFGASNVLPHITRQAQTPKGNIILSAYLSACMRRRMTVHGQDCEVQLLALPVIFEHGDARAIPSRIDSVTCERIQRRLLEAFCKEGKKDTLVIPGDRLFSPLEFESERPESFHAALAHVADAVSRNKLGLLQSYIEYPDSDEPATTDRFLFHGDTVFAPKLLPLFVLSPPEESLPAALSDARVTDDLAALLSMTVSERGPDGIENGFDSPIRARASTKPICNPFVAERAVCSEVMVRQLSLEVEELLSQQNSPWFSVVIRYNPRGERVYLQMYARAENNEINEYRYTLTLRPGYSTAAVALLAYHQLSALGVSDIELSETETDCPNLNLSRAIH